jgi:DNA polymerase IIIc chi subunit
MKTNLNISIDNEFMEYWNERTDSEIIAMLLEMDDKELKNVININDSVEIDQNNFIDVFDIVYLENKKRDDLMKLVKKYKTL